MSSIRVRTQNKVMEKLGAAKKSTNLQFEHAMTGFEAMQTDVVQLDNALRGFLASIRGFHSASLVLSRAIQQVSASDSEPPPVAKQFVSVYSDATTQIDGGENVDTLVAQFETSVLKASEGWIAQCDELKAEIAAFHEAHLNYDHYTRKVVGLREQRDKRATHGKSERSKDVDKLIRNEQKLVAATSLYRDLSDSIVKNLKHFTHSRYTTLRPLVQRLIQYRLLYSNTLAEKTGAQFKPLLNAQEGDDQMYLERLTRLVEDRKNNNETTDASVSQVDLQEEDTFVGGPVVVPETGIAQHSYSSPTKFNPFEPPPSATSSSSSVMDTLFNSPTGADAAAQRTAAFPPF